MRPVMELYVYNYAFRNQLPGMASAVAVILFLVTLVLIIPVFRYELVGEVEEMAIMDPNCPVGQAHRHGFLRALRSMLS